jgi:hypothetical protein
MADYQHPQDVNLSGPYRAMEYDQDGQPVMRVSIETVKPNSGLGTSIYNTSGNLNTGSDAFGRLRTSDPVTLFEANHVGGIANGKFYTVLTGAGSVDYNDNLSAAVLTADGTADFAATMYRSKRRMSYQPGKSLLVLTTFVMSAVTNGVIQSVGYYDDQDGVYLMNNQGTVSFVKRSSASGSTVNTSVAQADWNVDKLDGTGTSGITLDVTQSQILFMDFEWLGVGSVRCGFVIDGQFIVAHIFHNANINPGVYMRTASLPVTLEIDSVSGETASMQFICSSVISEGGYEPRAEGKVDGNPIIGVTVSTAWVNLVSIRVDSAYPHAIVVPSGIDILNVSNTDFEWALFVDATPATPFSFSNTVSEKVEVATNTVTFTNVGRRVYGGFMGGKTAPASIGDGALSWDNQLGRKNSSEYQTLTLAIRSASNSKTAAGLLKWYEV